MIKSKKFYYLLLLLVFLGGCTQQGETPNIKRTSSDKVEKKSFGPIVSYKLNGAMLELKSITVKNDNNVFDFYPVANSNTPNSLTVHIGENTNIGKLQDLSMKNTPINNVVFNSREAQQNAKKIIELRREIAKKDLIENQANQIEVMELEVSAEDRPNEAYNSLFKKISSISNDDGLKLNANTIAILIGNRTYKYSVPKVRFAHNDIDMIEQYLLSRGVNQNNIYKHEDKTFGEITQIFDLELDSIVGNNGLDKNILVYYSGHGVVDSSTSDPYILPVDTKPGYVSTHGYSLNKLVNTVSRLNVSNRSIIIESCFSGNTAGGQIFKDSSGVIIKPRDVQPGKNMLLITASGKDEVASWDKKYRLGLFTKNLVKGLSGEADTNSDNNVSLKELEIFVQDNVRIEARLNDMRSQNPVLRNGTN
ncbi:MAG: caspase family protein [Urechidicola sp.]|nr:caspase family protein [Urechidicola sp.]